MADAGLPGSFIIHQTIPIVSASASAPTALYTVYKATRRARLSGLTITNTQSPGTYEQVWVGVRYQSSTGTADWEAVVAPYLDGGESFSWEGAVYVAAGDELVSYAQTGSRATVTLELEDIKE